MLPGYVPGAPRPPQGRRGRGVGFGSLMVNTLGECGMRSAECEIAGQCHPKPSQSHPEANAECRMENAEEWGKADQSQPQARYKLGTRQELGRHPLVLLLFFRLAFGGAAVSLPRPCLILTAMVRPLFKRIRIFPSFAFPSTGLPEKALEFGAPAGSI